tara:strand:+ start:8677 stop:8892 length:216 start_codon:yes stop_codon:yes gene_type:complete
MISHTEENTTYENQNMFLVWVRCVRQENGRPITRGDVVKANTTLQIKPMGLEANYWVYDVNNHLRGATCDW